MLVELEGVALATSGAEELVSLLRPAMVHTCSHFVTNKNIYIDAS